MLSERIPLRRVKTMRKTLSGKNMLNNFPKEHAYRLPQISFRGSNLTIHPLRNSMDVSILGGWCSTAPPGALAYHWGSSGVARWGVGVGVPAEGRDTGKQGPPTREESNLTLNCWSLWLSLEIIRCQVNIQFLCQRCVICLRVIIPSELSEPLSYRGRVNHHWSKVRTNWKAIVNPQAEEFSFHRCKNNSTKKLLNLYSVYGHKNHCGYCF